MEQGTGFSLSPEFSSGHRYCWGSPFLLTAWLIQRNNKNFFCWIKWDLETILLPVNCQVQAKALNDEEEDTKSVCTEQMLCCSAKALQPHSGLLQHHCGICLPIISSGHFSMVSGPCIFYFGFNLIFKNIILFILPSSIWFKTLTSLTLAYNIFPFVFEIQRGV